ncbi:MAG: helix-turn-helix domain-containing protein [Sphingosinicella sp.]|nr:helix-turn-helix domain-containing protein [Sphingosinicella sp.]
MSEFDPGSVPTIGDRLKAAREAKKLSLDEIASKTRIPIRHLQHIEHGEWDQLPAPTYSIGFTRAYANAIGLNGNEVAAELREQIGRTRPTYETPQSYYEPADPARVPPKSLAMVAGAITLLLVVGYILWRTLSVGGSDVDPVEVAVAEAPLAAQQPAAAAAIPATGAVVITATDEVWLRIYDGGAGTQLFEGIMKAGDRFEIPATAQAPQIRTGRPQALRITVGGAEIPPLGQPEQTIDNVSLKPADLAARTQSGGAAQPGVAAQPLAVPPPPPAE